ncbi:cellular Repressor of E1A-stimulated Genes [Lycorma delicatula]|uniref:cellular Repressor of E1A-stimulated Genes n=1 Tax=Lycorma delicatula TaxID=130591 RepID=UPI003F517EE9
MLSFHHIFNLLIAGTLSYGYQIVQMDISGTSTLARPEPPPVSDAARYARYIVHYSDWCAVSHISYQPNTKGFPMARIFSMSDGTLSNSSGIPYIYTTPMDEGTRDLLKDNRCSVTISLAEGNFCHLKQLDPEDPRCPQVVLTGNFEIVRNDTEEYKWAKKALYFRHPQMKNWPISHHWFVAKLKIENILLVNNVGGNKYPSVEDYFKSNPVVKEVNTPFVIS